MNPNATPERIKQAEEAMRNQTEETVRDIEANRPVRPPAAAVIHGVLDVVEEARKRLLGNVPKLRVRLVVEEVHQNFDPAHADLQISELVEFRASDESDPQRVQVAVYTPNEDDFGFFKKGDEVHMDLIPVVDAAPAKEHVPLASGGGSKAGGGVADGTRLPTLEEAQRAYPNENITEGAPPITGTTGSKGTVPASVRMQPAPGAPPNPEDPNLTGPSSDKQQPVKGEIEDGMQTGGTTGKGTSDGNREDSQFGRHHGDGDDAPSEAAREK